MKSFNIPEFYRSPVISRIKMIRKIKDPKKQDFSPTILDFGPVVIYIARHFGFCFGVENAVEISFRALEENPGKRIFLLSQMIHNPEVNNDLVSRGVQFLMEPNGKEIYPLEKLEKDDIVIIPAFGTTLEIENRLSDLGIKSQQYNTTCPFVERVWNKSGQLGAKDYTIVVHGKPSHEETKATFSHAKQYGAVIVLKDMEETKLLGEYMLGQLNSEKFNELFKGRTSENFNPEKQLDRIGVINQTTMLASETQAISDYLKKILKEKFGENEIKNHFADTRDTLCYATNENQEATFGLLKIPADLALVVGGYNSSNTTHIAELCAQKFPTYFIKDDSEIISASTTRHFDLETEKVVETSDWMSTKKPMHIILTSGASCPDSVVDRVLYKIVGMFENCLDLENVIRAEEKRQ